MAELELYGPKSCPNTEEMRDWLKWNQREFVEYDVDTDREALRRMRKVTGGQRTVPVLVEDGRVLEVGWRGRGCVVGGGTAE